MQSLLSAIFKSDCGVLIDANPIKSRHLSSLPVPCCQPMEIQEGPSFLQEDTAISRRFSRCQLSMRIPLPLFFILLPLFYPLFPFTASLSLLFLFLVVVLSHYFLPSFNPSRFPAGSFIASIFL